MSCLMPVALEKDVVDTPATCRNVDSTRLVVPVCVHCGRLGCHNILVT